MLDTKIINGWLVDGTGAPRRRGDIGIRDGRIVAVGEVEEDALEVIDAQGNVVAPGFIDVHTHYDAQVFWDPSLSPSCYHGVTTVFGGFCGFSIAPLSPEAGEYLMPMLARVEGMPLESLAEGVPWDWDSFGSYLERIEGKVALNAGFMAGHSAIRRVVMGERAVGETATPQELEAMQQLLRASLAEGAMGFSSTVSPTHNDAAGRPVPSRHASREELLGLAAVVAEFEGTTLELLPAIDFSDATLDLLADFSRAGQRPVNWNLLSLSSTNPEELQRVERQLHATDHARARGAEVIALTVPQTPNVRINLHSGFLFDAFPGWESLFQLPVAQRLEKLRDPEFRRALEQGAQSMQGVMAGLARWENLQLVETFSATNKPYEGRMVGEIAAELGKSPFDTLIDLALADELKSSFMPMLGSDGAELYRQRAAYWRDDRTVIGGSDAGAHLDMIDTFAFSTKVLQYGVREYGAMDLEEAVHQLTQVPARLMGLRERGLLHPGWHADIVIFDPERIACGEVYTRFDMPAGAGRLYADATGVARVLVNGRTVIDDGRYTGDTPGTVLRSGRDTRTVTSMRTHAPDAA